MTNDTTAGTDRYRWMTSRLTVVTVNGQRYSAYTATNNGDGTWTLADDTITLGDQCSG